MASVYPESPPSSAQDFAAEQECIWIRPCAAQRLGTDAQLSRLSSSMPTERLSVPFSGHRPTLSLLSMEVKQHIQKGMCRSGRDGKAYP